MAKAQISIAAILGLAGSAQAMRFDVPPLSLDPVGPPATAPVTAGADDSEDAGYGITDNWWGVRDTLRKRGIDVGGSVLFDTSKVLRGGLDTRAWPTSYLLDVHMTIDMETVAGLKGGTVFVCFQSHDQSENGDAAVGDSQVFDNISAPRYVQVAQLWYRQTVGDFRFKIGKIDSNADACRPSEDANDCFSLMEHGLDFMQSAAAFTPTVFAMPTYPEGAPGAEIFYGKELYLGVGGFYSNRHQTFLNVAGHPEKGFPANGGMFVIAEGGARWNWDAGDSLMGPGHAGIGGWYHCGDFQRVDGTGMNRGAGGGYLFIDQSISHYEKAGETTRDTGFFFEAGTADRTTSPMDQNLIFGISASGWIPNRPDDSLGMMASWVHFPAPGLAHSYEIATEAFYKIQLTPWASVKPSLAYIVSPSGVERDAAVASVRVEVDF